MWAWHMHSTQCNPLNAQFTPGLCADLSSIRRSDVDSVQRTCAIPRRSEVTNLELNNTLLLHRTGTTEYRHRAPEQAPLAQLVNHGGHRGNVSE